MEVGEKPDNDYGDDRDQVASESHVKDQTIRLHGNAEFPSSIVPGSTASLLLSGTISGAEANTLDIRVVSINVSVRDLMILFLKAIPALVTVALVFSFTLGFIQLFVRSIANLLWGH